MFGSSIEGTQRLERRCSIRYHVSLISGATRDRTDGSCSKNCRDTRRYKGRLSSRIDFIDRRDRARLVHEDLEVCCSIEGDACPQFLARGRLASGFC